jgi:hypothetical protein
MVSIYRRVQRLAGLAVAAVSLTLLSTVQADRIPAGLHYFETVPGKVGSRTGTSFVPAILSGFFGPGSDGFIGGAGHPPQRYPVP